jgi:hypothetical protein
MKADVGEIGGGYQGAGKGGHVEAAEANIVPPQDVEHPLIEPGLVAEFEDVAESAGQKAEEGVQHLIVAVHVWRELVEEGAQLFIEEASPAQEVLQRLSRTAQSLLYG